MPDGNAAAWGAALPWCTPQGVRLTGRVLGTSGLRLPVLYPDRVVLVRTVAGGAVHECPAPFRPLRAAIGPDGVPMWCAFEGGLWRWTPGEAPERVIDTPVPIHLHVTGEGAVRIDAATRAEDGAAIRRRLRTAWQWRAGASQLDWVSNIATAHAKFVQDVSAAYVSAAREMLK